MASSFAAQLAQIAAVSTNELDLKAQKAAHSDSFLFERKVAGGQDFVVIYQICLEGFQDLCRLDARFNDFEHNLFSAQSKSQDRAQMTERENQALDIVVENFLLLLGSRLLLRPALKALEWLIRRFKVHSYNTSLLLSTFLPYHETPIFQNVLSILAPAVPIEYKFLAPYLKTATNPPRHAIAYSATTSDAFFNAFSAYTIKACQNGASYPALLSFWSSVVIEAVSGRLALAQSGRKEVQRQRQEDVLLHILPLLNDGFAVQTVPEMTLVCYTMTMILAEKCALNDNVLDSLMEAVAATMRSTSTGAGMVCLVILSTQREGFVASEKLISSAVTSSGFDALLSEQSWRYPTDRLIRALVRGCMHDLKRKRKARLSRISLVERLIGCSRQDPTLVHLLFRDIAGGILQLREQEGDSTALVSSLTEMIRKIGDSQELSDTTTDGFGQLDTLAVDGAASIEGPPALMDVDGEGDQASTSKFAEALKHLPERTVDERSFLLPTESRLFEQLREIFLICCNDKNGLSKFQSLPLWQSTADVDSALYMSFLLKIACGPYSARVRATAFMLTAQDVTANKKAFDGQALLPYLAVALTSPAQNVRRAAAEVISAIHSKTPKSLVQGEECLSWGHSTLYEPSRMTEKLWVPLEDSTKLVEQVFVSSLEECIMDHTHIGRVITSALNGSSARPSTNAKIDLITLKKSLRHGLFDLFTSHLTATPLYGVKSDLVLLLANVDKVGSTSRPKALMPVLEAWASQDNETVEHIVSQQGLRVAETDARMMKIVSGRDREFLVHLKLLLSTASLGRRNELVNAVFVRIAALWKDIKLEMQIEVSRYLFELSQTNDHLLSRPSRNALLSVNLSTAALIGILEESSGTMQGLVDQPPPTKRRRTSHGQVAKPIEVNTRTLGENYSDLTFALEIIDNANVRDHPELLHSLFRTLGLLQGLASHVGAQTSYLLHLCLGSILNIVQSARTLQRTKPDLSAIPTALVTECIRSADNAQVQSTALLLAAELAAIAPDSILHHLMPIFTFMGKRVLSKNDDHSINVVNNVIDLIVPPMVKSLVNQKTDITEGTSELLLSFCSAFHDVPRSRRLALFRRLIYATGPEDVLHAVVSLLLVPDRDQTEVRGFVVSLVNEFTPHVQLATITKILGHIQALAQHPKTLSKVLFDMRDADEETKDRAIAKLLAAIQDLLESSELKIKVDMAFRTKGSTDGTDVALTLRSDIGANIAQILVLLQAHRSLDLVDTALRCCITALFDLVPFSEYFGYVSDFLQEENVERRLRVLQILNARLQPKANQDRISRKAAVEFLSTLVQHVESEADVSVRHAAIASIDSIIEHYGRKNPDEIIVVVRSLLTSKAVNEDDTSHTAVTLCLASMVETLKEAIIPILPALVSKAMQMLERSITEDHEDEQLHNAAYALLAGLLTHVSFMFADEHLDRLLYLSAESVNAEMPGDCGQTRLECFALVARKIQLSIIIASVSRTWSNTVENGSAAVGEVLDLVSNSIEVTTKSTVVKVAESLSSVLLQILDIRRIQFTDRTEDSYTVDEITGVETKTNELIIKFIYKLNDSVFRPLFSTWIDWASRCPGIKPLHLPQAKILRRTTLFRFVAHFCGTLKSIVTSYTSYVLEPAISILDSTLSAVQSPSSPSSPSSPEELRSEDDLTLWNSTLFMLREAATHDQDSFFTSSTHFQALASTLISQLTLASNSSLQPHVTTYVIPAIVALVSSVTDNASRHGTINHSICQLRHSEHAAVRLMSIKTQQALSESEDIGEEWVNHLVAQGGEVMVYVNEMLEDDDEEVEREVRRWVRTVGEMVGEDIFEA